MLEEFGPSLYVADGPTVSFLSFPYPTRMAVARLRDGSAWVWSPIALTPELERYVVSKVEEGLYSSQSEVVRHGLRLLIERDELLDARIAELRVGWASLLPHAHCPAGPSCSSSRREESSVSASPSQEIAG